MSSAPTRGIPAATLNRLSIYLRGLRQLEEHGLETVSSQDFAERFHLSSVQIRKDLAQFGDFGIRGVGYEITALADRLYELLGLHRKQRLVIVGMGNLGRALARYVGFNDDSFEVVAGFDVDPAKIGAGVDSLEVHPMTALASVVAETAAEIGVLTVPAEAAAESFEALVAAGIRAILNFAPVNLGEREGVKIKNVDLRIYLEETSSYLLQGLAERTKESE